LAGKLAKEASGESAATSLSTAEIQLLIVGSKIVSRTMVIAILQLDAALLLSEVNFGNLPPHFDMLKFARSERQIQRCRTAQLPCHLATNTRYTSTRHLHDRLLNALVDAIFNLTFGFVSRRFIEHLYGRVGQ
jgi:hypothetical protein